MQLPQITSVDAFVAWEETQAEAYEFAAGEISFLPGGTMRHDIVALNIQIALRRVVAASHVFGPNVKQLTSSSSRYPDIAVTFDARDAVELTYARYPSLIVEVLSPSTYGVDRGPKLDEYRTIETLREYVLVDSRKRWAQTIRRSEDAWIVSLPILSGALTFASVGLTLPFDQMYEGTGLD
jgi:Uma2 family endonuclease